MDKVSTRQLMLCGTRGSCHRRRAKRAVRKMAEPKHTQSKKPTTLFSVFLAHSMLLSP